MTSTNQTRCLFIIGSLTGGGSERQLVDILRHLDRDRFAPLLYLIYHEGALRDEVPSDVPTTSFWDYYDWPRWNFPGTILRQQARHIAQVARHQGVDVVCDRNFNVTLASSMATRSLALPSISVVDCEPRADLEANAGKFRAMKRLMLRRAYHGANRVVAVSEGVRAGLRQYYGLPDQQIELIPNFVDCERIARLATAFVPEANGDRFRIVSVGRLQPQKGYADMLQALRQLVHDRGYRQVHWSICGDGPLDGELRRLIGQLDLADHVELLGFQANPFPYVKHANVFCLPSRYEGLPTALAEAMACGTPVIATDCPSGPHELLAGGDFGRLVPVAQPTRLADALEDAIRQSPSYRATAAAAKDRIDAQFSVTSGVAKYEALLEEVRTRR